MVENINEIAIIFKRIQNEDETIYEFVPFKVVEGYYHEEEYCFIDSEQNVYSHIASLAEVGNVYGGRKLIYDIIKVNPNRSLNDNKKIILETAKKYKYYKNVADDAKDYNIVKMMNKEDNTTSIFHDKDSELFYEMYSELTNDKEVTTHTTADNKNNSLMANESEKQEVYATPQEMIDEIKKTIKGQDEAIETIVTMLWMKYIYPDIPKSNMLIIGPSGCGKTAIFKKIKELLGIPMSIYGITGTSQSGYKGHDIEEMLENLYYDSDSNLEAAQNGIIFIDEFDKVAANRDTGDIGTIAVQNELLKIVEGCERTIELGMHQSVTIDTSNIIFVCCGAFSDLFEEKKEKVVGFNNYPTVKEKNEKVTTDKIISYGIIRELAGRLPVIIQLNDLNNNKEVLKDILLNSDESLFTAMINTINEEGITIENLEEVIDIIVDDAIERKIGARGLTSPIRNIFIKIFFDIANNPGKYEKLIIGKNIVKDNRDYELVPKKVKKRTKSKNESLMII